MIRISELYFVYDKTKLEETAPATRAR